MCVFVCVCVCKCMCAKIDRYRFTDMYVCIYICISYTMYLSSISNIPPMDTATKCKVSIEEQL